MISASIQKVQSLRTTPEDLPTTIPLIAIAVRGLPECCPSRKCRREYGEEQEYDWAEFVFHAMVVLCWKCFVVWQSQRETQEAGLKASATWKIEEK